MVGDGDAAALEAGAAAGETGATDDSAAVAELAALIAAAAGADAGWASGITATTSLHDDLELESVELTVLAAALRDRYGPTVDLAGYLTGLDLDQLIELTVGELAAYVARCRAGDHPRGSRS